MREVGIPEESDYETVLFLPAVLFPPASHLLGLNDGLFSFDLESKTQVRYPTLEEN